MSEKQTVVMFTTKKSMLPDIYSYDEYIDAVNNEEACDDDGNIQSYEDWVKMSMATTAASMMCFMSKQMSNHNPILAVVGDGENFNELHRYDHGDLARAICAGMNDMFEDPGTAGITLYSDGEDICVLYEINNKSKYAIFRRVGKNMDHIELCEMFERGDILPMDVMTYTQSIIPELRLIFTML